MENFYLKFIVFQNTYLMSILHKNIKCSLYVFTFYHALFNIYFFYGKIYLIVNQMKCLGRCLI